ncbi:hypothetical protein CF635_003583 [Enterobacter hormaechei]|nr:hypothetical protein [Enterobacter hormaechei]
MEQASYLNHSDNWHSLLNLIGDSQSFSAAHKTYSWLEHKQARALAIFLSNATLATPVLDRITVTELLAGEFAWPRTDGNQIFIKSDYTLSFYEDAGLLSFYGDWCAVHCRPPSPTVKMDESIRTLVEVIERLREISLGLKGYIRPYFSCPETKFLDLLHKEFGSASEIDLLPDIKCVDGTLILKPDTVDFGSLHSTYLWQHLSDSLSPTLAFKHWLQCMRVQTGTLIPVSLPLTGDDKDQIFLREVLTQISEDPAMQYTLKTINRQIVNDAAFDRIISPSTININISLTGNNEKSEVSTSTYTSAQVTAETLGQCYSSFPGDDLTKPDVLTAWSRRGDRGLFINPYTGLIRVCLDNVIQVEHRMLSATCFATQLFQLRKTSPVLRFMLLFLLPSLYGGKQCLYLLSKSDTCGVGVFHLLHRKCLRIKLPDNLSGGGLESSYQELLVTEYLRAALLCSGEEDHLLQTILYLAERCTFGTTDLQNAFDTSLLARLLNTLNDDTVVILADDFLSISVSSWKEHKVNKVRSLWYLGFWLIKRVESTGMPQTESLHRRLRDCLRIRYEENFISSMCGEDCNLVPDSFWSLLPWSRIVDKSELRSFLRLSSAFSSWDKAFTLTDAKNLSAFTAVSAARQFLQLLLTLAGNYSGEDGSEQIHRRIIDIVCAHGFGKNRETLFLFEQFATEEVKLLWQTFCRFLNKVPQSLYEDFLDRCAESISLDSLYILLESTTTPKRNQELQDVILKRQSVELEDLAPDVIFDAFASACHQKHLVLAAGLLEKAHHFIEKFRELNHHEYEWRWNAYSYRYTLLAILDREDNPGEFERIANETALPDDMEGGLLTSKQQQFQRECDYFRRYIIASAYLEDEPTRCMAMMSELCKETMDSNHAFLLFQARLAVNGKRNKSELLYALNKFLEAVRDTPVSEMNVRWVANILETMRCTFERQKADSFWNQLNTNQRQTLQVLIPYCRLLIAHGNPWIARQILADFGVANLSCAHEPELKTLLDELSGALPGAIAMSELIYAVADINLRTPKQLAIDYSQIVSSPFPDYVSIVRKKCTPEVFLQDIVIEISNEILLRKKNLHIQATSKKPGKLVNEDLINDWFTSLFDKRMAEARVGFRDQKRAGQSASGEMPGEVDGFITDSTNKRIAVFEAFRLTALSKKVINSHLDKIAGYDGEALSPVFIVAYCDLPAFSKFTKRYNDYIDRYEYKGYSRPHGERITISKDTDQLWVGQECRQRNRHDVIFYHVLLNLR